MKRKSLLGWFGLLISCSTSGNPVPGPRDTVLRLGSRKPLPVVPLVYLIITSLLGNGCFRAEKRGELVDQWWSNILHTTNRLESVPADVYRIRDRFGFTLLHRAAICGNSNVLKTVLATCPRDMITNWYGMSSPLACAVQWGQPEAVRLLLDAGADPNARDITGATPLIDAAACYLLSSRTNLSRDNVLDAEGLKEWHSFVPKAPPHASNIVAAAKFLLQSGANPETADNEGLTAFDYATKSGVPMVAAFFSNIQMRAVKPIRGGKP